MNNIDKIAKEIIAGASSFVEYGEGKDANSVFRQVQQNARHMHGHDGYSGTVGEKDSFRIVSEPVTKDQARKVINDMIGSNDKWGPAFAIPVLKSTVAKQTTKPFKKLVRAPSIQVAKSELRKHFDETFKDYKWAIKGYENYDQKAALDYLKPEISGLAPSVKLVSKNKPVIDKFSVMVSDKPDQNAYASEVASFKTYPEADAFIKNELVNKFSAGKSIAVAKIRCSISNPDFAIYSFSAKGSGGKFLFVGDVVLTKIDVSNEIIGYFFFGMASD